MDSYLWILVAYVLGIFTGAAALILAACWNDIKNWINDIMWKIKLWRMR